MIKIDYIYMCVVIEIVYVLVIETHARCPLRWKIPGSLAHDGVKSVASFPKRNQKAA